MTPRLRLHLSPGEGCLKIRLEDESRTDLDDRKLVSVEGGVEIVFQVAWVRDGTSVPRDHHLGESKT